MTTAHGSSALEHICVLCSECAAAESVDISVLKEIFDTATAALAIGPAPQEDEAVATVTYTNWRGETSTRRIIPKSVRYGSTEWHPEPQWLLLAWDDDKKTDREFALKDFGPAPQPPVEGLVPVYVKKWRTLIMVPPSIRDEINADIAALASPSLTAGPVAWRVKNDFGHWYITQDKAMADTYRDIEKLNVEPLYAAPATLIEQSGQKETQTAKHTSSRTEASATETAGGEA